MTHTTPDNFLGLDQQYSTLETSKVVVLPIPFEATVSYGGGTVNGPTAIIEASQQVEFYDREFDTEPAKNWGVHTLPSVDVNDQDPDSAMHSIAKAVEQTARLGKLVCVLGGEHSVSGAVAQGLQAVHGDFVTVQIDAHADLRDEYEGSKHSHACAMRRILDVGAGDLLQLGIRSLDISEAHMIKTDPRITTFYSENVHDGLHLPALRDFVRGKQVYFTIDIDGLDVGLVPATGTPEPDGLTWREVLEITRILVQESSKVVAFDIMELAPIENLHSPNFVSAKLTYKVMSIIMAKQADLWQ